MSKAQPTWHHPQIIIQKNVVIVFQNLEFFLLKLATCLNPNRQIVSQKGIKMKIKFLNKKIPKLEPWIHWVLARGQLLIPLFDFWKKIKNFEHGVHILGNQNEDQPNIKTTIVGILRLFVR